MIRRIAISDMHGCARTFQKLVEENVRLEKSDELYLLGDYINKGPDSKAVIDYIFTLRESGFFVKCLRGNHDQYLLDALKFPSEEIVFLSHGGRETLMSFGVEKITDIPERYLHFFRSLRFYIPLNKFLLVHAGFDFSLEDPFNDAHSMLNIREIPVGHPKSEDKIIIHGHVPKKLDAILEDHEKELNHYSIDGGCVYKHLQGMNYMIALDLSNWKLYIEKNID